VTAVDQSKIYVTELFYLHYLCFLFKNILGLCRILIMLHINLQSDSDQRHNDQTQLYCTTIIMYYCKSPEAIFIRTFTYFVPAGYTTDVEQVFIPCF